MNPIPTLHVPRDDRTLVRKVRLGIKDEWEVAHRHSKRGRLHSHFCAPFASAEDAVAYWGYGGKARKVEGLEIDLYADPTVEVVRRWPEATP